MKPRAKPYTTEQSEFLNEVLEMVRHIPIENILYEIYELPQGWCPFHNDKHAGSFKVLHKSNRYRCFSCGAYGDGIDFVQKKENMSFVEVVLKLALQFEILSTDQVKAFKLGKVAEKQINQPPKIYEGILEDHATNEIADVEKRHDIYTLFSKGNSILKTGEKLSKRHLEHLKKERKLSEKDIERIGFFSIPSRSKRYGKAFFEALNNQYGYEPNDIEGIPGFFKLISEDDNKEVTFVGHRGIGIPIKNKHEKIVGIQIRRDQKKEGESRYIWFSSSFANQPDRTDMEGGTGSGSPIHISYPRTNEHPHDIFLTEGVFKSEAIANFANVIAISVQGIQNWRGQIEDFISYLEEEKGHPIYRLHFMFDSDIANNVHVYEATKSMYENLKEVYPNIGFMHYWWNETFGKGIDDVLNQAHASQIKHLDSKTFFTAYDKMIQLLEDETATTINELDKEWIHEYFVVHVAPLFQKKR